MTDRELLELAAKAIGLRHIQYTNDYDGSMGLMQCDEHGRHTYTWNPLLDDGDALRLAVKLGMTISLIPPYEKDSYCSVVADWSDETGYPRTSIRIKHGGDPLAATRRAITRAAAELAKQEKS